MISRRGGANDRAAVGAQHQPRNLGQRPSGSRAEHVEQLDQRDLSLPGHDGRGAAVEIQAGMIARVRSGDDDRDAAIARRVDHRERRLPHAQQAHLAQIVEAVLVKDRIVRTMTIERAAPLGLRLGEHRVEQRNVVAVRPHGGRRIQRSQRRVRLACIPELRIEPQEVGLAEQDDRVRGVNSVHRVPKVHEGARGAWRARRNVGMGHRRFAGDAGIRGNRNGRAGSRSPGGQPVDLERLAGGAVPREEMRALQSERREVLAALAASRQTDNRLAQRVGVEAIDLFDGAAGDFRQRRHVPRDHRRPAGHGLDHRQAETLVERRKHEHLRQAVQRRQVLERHVAGEADRVLDLQTLDAILDVAAQPAVRAGAHELMRQIAGLAALREALDQLRQVLPRLDRADVEDEPVGKVVPPPDPLPFGRIVNRAERGRRRFVHDVHALGRQAVQANDVALGALRDGDDRVRPARRDVDQRPVQEHTPRRMVAREQRQAHVVDRHHRRHRRSQRNHPVREVDDVHLLAPQQPGSERLHPEHPRDAPRRAGNPHVGRQGPRRVDGAIGDDDDLIVARPRREMVQQVLGVVAHAGAAGTKCRAVKCDAHGSGEVPAKLT